MNYVCTLSAIVPPDCPVGGGKPKAEYLPGTVLSGWTACAGYAYTYILSSRVEYSILIGTYIYLGTYLRVNDKHLDSLPCLQQARYRLWPVSTAEKIQTGRQTGCSVSDLPFSPVAIPEP